MIGVWWHTSGDETLPVLHCFKINSNLLLPAAKHPVFWSSESLHPAAVVFLVFNIICDCESLSLQDASQTATWQLMSVSCAFKHKTVSWTEGSLRDWASFVHYGIMIYVPNLFHRRAWWILVAVPFTFRWIQASSCKVWHLLMNIKITHLPDVLQIYHILQKRL